MCRRIVSYAMEGPSTFEYDVMAVLDQNGPMKGLAVKKELEEQFHKYDGQVNHGRLYPNLDNMAQRDLIEKSERDRRTNEYALTNWGHNALTDRVEELGGEL